MTPAAWAPGPACGRGPCAGCGGQAATNLPGGPDLCWACLPAPKAGAR